MSNRVANANVTMRWVWLIAGNDQLGRCKGNALDTQTAQADSDGNYSIEVRGGPFPYDVCLIVDATAASRGVQLAGSTEVDSVRIGPSGLFALQVLVKVRR